MPSRRNVIKETQKITYRNLEVLGHLEIDVDSTIINLEEKVKSKKEKDIVLNNELREI